MVRKQAQYPQSPAVPKQAQYASQYPLGDLPPAPRPVYLASRTHHHTFQHTRLQAHTHRQVQAYWRTRY